MSKEESAARLSGLGRVLITVYIVLALAASFRSFYQILRKFDEAPVAYTLSAVSAVVYIVATIALIKHRGVWRKIAWAALAFELVGVLVVGTLSLTMPQYFAHPSVWSVFGIGYIFIPLVIPVLGLIWLYRTRPVAGSTPADPISATTTTTPTETTDIQASQDTQANPENPAPSPEQQ